MHSSELEDPQLFPKSSLTVTESNAEHDENVEPHSFNENKNYYLFHLIFFTK